MKQKYFLILALILLFRPAFAQSRNCPPGDPECTEEGDVEAPILLGPQISSKIHPKAFEAVEAEVVGTVQSIVIDMTVLEDFLKDHLGESNYFAEAPALCAREINTQLAENSSDWASSAGAFAWVPLYTRLSNLSPKVEFTGIYRYCKGMRNSGTWERVRGNAKDDETSADRSIPFDIVINIPKIPDPKFKLTVGITSLDFKIDEVKNPRATPSSGDPSPDVQGVPRFKVTAHSTCSITSGIGFQTGGSSVKEGDLERVQTVMSAKNPTCE